MHNACILQQYVCYTTILNMFREARCSSSGGQIVSLQPLVSSPSVNSRTVWSLRVTYILLKNKEIVHHVGNLKKGCTMMHGQKNIKLCNAEQAKRVYQYKNIKIKLYKNNAAIWYDKICRTRHLTPTYDNINIKGRRVRSQPAFCTAVYRGWRYQRL